MQIKSTKCPDVEVERICSDDAWCTSTVVIHLFYRYRCSDSPLTLLCKELRHLVAGDGIQEICKEGCLSKEMATSKQSCFAPGTVTSLPGALKCVCKVEWSHVARLWLQPRLVSLCKRSKFRILSGACQPSLVNSCSKTRRTLLLKSHSRSKG